MGKRTNWATCKRTGKRRFRTQEDAETALRESRKLQQNRWHGGKRAECRWYRCEFCDGFHLTSRQSRTTDFTDSMEALRLETLQSLQGEPGVFGDELGGPAPQSDAMLR
jgi:hypothetical protein